MHETQCTSVDVPDTSGHSPVSSVSWPFWKNCQISGCLVRAMIKSVSWMQQRLMLKCVFYEPFEWWLFVQEGGPDPTSLSPHLLGIPIWDWVSVPVLFRSSSQSVTNTFACELLGGIIEQSFLKEGGQCFSAFVVHNSLWFLSLSFFFPFLGNIPVYFHDVGRKAGEVAKRTFSILLKVRFLKFFSMRAQG